MGLIIVSSDFTGKYAIAQDSYSSIMINTYISKYEVKYLIDLLGVELYKLFAASVTAHVPAAGIYKTIFDPIMEDNDSCIRLSDGIKEMLLGFLYFEIIRDQKYSNTVSGTVIAASENNREGAFEEINIFNRFNEAIKSYKTIQWFISDNNNDANEYPLYNGQCKQKTNFI